MIDTKLNLEGSLNTTFSSGGGTTNYDLLGNKPSINNIELSGNKTLEELGIQPSGNYLTEGDMTDYIEEHKEELKGADGQDGYTPVRGTDYWTETDIAEIKNYVDEAILGGAW